MRARSGMCGGGGLERRVVRVAAAIRVWPCEHVVRVEEHHAEPAQLCRVAARSSYADRPSRVRGAAGGTHQACGRDVRVHCPRRAVVPLLRGVRPLDLSSIPAAGHSAPVHPDVRGSRQRTGTLAAQHARRGLVSRLPPPALLVSIGKVDWPPAIEYYGLSNVRVYSVDDRSRHLAGARIIPMVVPVAP